MAKRASELIANRSSEHEQIKAILAHGYAGGASPQRGRRALFDSARPGAE
jgi:hypothetical protein